MTLSQAQKLEGLSYQHHGLNELDVAELRIPMNVSSGDEQGLLANGRRWTLALPARRLRLQKRGQGDVVLSHYAVQHHRAPLSVRHRNLVELYQVLLQ